MTIKSLLPLVLVIDDDEFILATTCMMLENLGCPQVVTASSAIQALTQIQSSEIPVTLALCDLNMPDIDGVELLRLLAENSFEGDIILFSGENERTLSMAVNLAKARNLSILGALSKPLNAEALQALLDKKVQAAHARPTTQKVTPEQLADAIANEQLVPWFQPKVDIASKQVVSFEALVRWPIQGGMIFPDNFIPIAEAHDMIDQLTFLMIKHIVRLNKLWLEQGLKLKIALNLSMDSLKNLDFPDTLIRLMGAENGDTTQFQLEITESRLMDDYVSVLDVLLRLRLRLKQMRLSIDDFGTGHSNFEQLHSLPFDELKLDKSYVQGAAHDAKSQAILESSVQIAQKLGMQTVAEGVETTADWQRIALLGCDQAQGYLISRAIPGEQLAAWLAQWPQQYTKLFTPDITSG